VLYEPGAVFGRVRGGGGFVVPFLAICAVQIVLFFVNIPFLRAGVAAQMAARGAPAGAPDPTKFLWIGAIFIPIGIGVVLLISGLALWVLVSVFGAGESSFGKLLAVAAYSAIPSVILLAIAGSVVLHMQGVGQITSPQDLQPALGLDLLAPSATGFVGAALKAINPFAIWGLVLTAIGVSTTHRLPKSTGYTIATITFVISVCIAGGAAAIFKR
jgi:hypothetical protein